MLELNMSEQLRKSRLYGIICLIYSIAFPILVSLIPINTPSPEVSWLEWLLLIMMPIDLIIVLILYTSFKQTTKIPLLGKTILLYTMGVAPSIYGTILLFLNSILKYIGVIFGLVFSLMSIGLILILSPNMALEESES
jgi:hypothetical protein